MSDPDECLREGGPCRPEPEVISWQTEKHYAEDGSRIEAAFRKYFHRASPAQRNDSYEVRLH
jgi:serine/threonine-protein phosphatase PGAM5